jgi:V/A-type H+-transporting ATPase subunit F
MKIAVLTDAESAAGYRLAGLHVTVAADTAEARKVLARMIQEGDTILIAVSEALLPNPYQAVKREMRGRDLPVLLSAPSPFSAATAREEDAEAYMRQLILSTIGHEIKL